MPKDSVLNGIGIYDLPLGLCLSEVARTWRRMLYRCYDPRTIERCHTYQGCTVCDEWKHASNFKKWFDENYVEGYDLDKDLLCNGSKIYSPDTCCFVPHKINMMIIKTNKKRVKYPMGVSFCKDRQKYMATITIRDTRKNLGRYSTVEEAFQAYKTAKEAYIKEVAQEYYDRGEITKKVYDALMRYEVEITD